LLAAVRSGSAASLLSVNQTVERSPSRFSAVPREDDSDAYCLCARDRHASLAPREYLPARARYGAAVGPAAGSICIWRRSPDALVGGRMPVAGRRAMAVQSCRSPRAAAPMTACWSSYSWSYRHACGFPIHRLARIGCAARPAWDCRLSGPKPSDAIHRSDSFAHPIRRVFGTLVFYAREHVEMPPARRHAAGAHRVDLRDRRTRFYSTIRRHPALPRTASNYLQS